VPLRTSAAVLFASDLTEHDGGDLRDLPLTDRKRCLAELIGKVIWMASRAKFLIQVDEVKIGAALVAGGCCRKKA
jgi:ATP-dependent DNA ligase